jgi:hypothetical protein
MLGCPIKTSKEWQDVLARANGNEEAALGLWAQEGFENNPKLNEYPEVEIKPDEEQQKDRMAKVLDDVKVILNKQYEELKKKKVPNQSFKEKRLAKLKEDIETLEGADAINLFIDDVFKNSNLLVKRMKTIISRKEAFSSPREFLQEMMAVNDFVNGYTVLDELMKADIYSYFSGTEYLGKKVEDYTPQDKITAALANKKIVQETFVEEGIPIMAEILLEFRSESSKRGYVEEIARLKEKIEEVKGLNKSEKSKQDRIEALELRIKKYESFSLDKNDMIKLLREASKDESVLAFLIDPMISSEDAALSLFAKLVKSQFEDARLKDIDIQEEAADALKKYRDSGEAQRQGNAAIFNEGIYEDIEVLARNWKGKVKRDEDGNAIFEKRKAFVQKFRMTDFEKAKFEFFKEIGDMPAAAPGASETEKRREEEWRKKRSDWYKQNTQAKSKEEIDEIIRQKQYDRNAGILTEDEYKAWEKSVMYTDKNGNVTYMKELSEPSDKWLNPNWLALYDKSGKPINAKGKYHKFLTELYFKQQELLPESQRQGYILPSIPKSDLERLQTKGLLTAAKLKGKEAITITAKDTEFGVAGLSEESIKFLPIFYTQPIDAEDVSLDLLQSVLMFSAMANRYDAMNKINAEVSLFKTIIGKRKTIETTYKGKPIIDSFAKKLGYTEYIKKNGESWSKRHVDAFIDMVVYGESQIAAEIAGIAASKIVGTLMGFSAITTLSMDALKGVSNNLQANIQLIIEANAGEFFSKKNLAKATSTYAGMTGGFLADLTKPTVESLGGKLVEYYDAIQGEFKDHYGKQITSTVAMKLFSSNTLFWNMKAGEHEVQVKAMFALMDSTMVKDNETGEEISLLEAHKKYGVKEVLEKTSFTEKNRKDFQNRLHAINKKLHGVYNSFDAATISRFTLGRLGLMYRKFLVPSYRRRYNSLRMDEELGAPTEGFYRTFWNTVVRDLRDYKFNVMQNWSTYTPFEKAQVKRMLAELTIILTIVSLIGIMLLIAGDDEEDDAVKKTYAYNFMMYQLTRMRSETDQYLPVYGLKDAYRVVKSPSAMTSTVDRAIKFIDQFFINSWTEEGRFYQRESGVWNKGDNKSWAYFLKLMGFSGYNFTPEAALEAFKGSLNK